MHSPIQKSLGGTSVSEQKLIAVIDDDPEILESVELLLSCHGYDTKLFASAEELLCVAPTLEAACLIVDIQLGGISGLNWSALFAQTASPCQ
jgi:FixJ family two-component response regulator